MIQDDPRHNVRRWVEQRLGWALLAVLVAAALLGLLGPGWLSRAVARTPDGSLRVRYERCGRLEAPSLLEIETNARADQPVEVRLPRHWVEAIQITQVSPPPESSTPGAADWVLRYPAGASGAFIRIHFEFKRAGRRAGRVTLADGTHADFRQFVYP